jgi:hypothetical protein
VARTSCFATKEILSAWTAKHRGGKMCLWLPAWNRKFVCCFWGDDYV